jgi:hypothetical protein
VACHKEAAKYVYAQKRYTEVAGVAGKPVEASLESSDFKDLLALFKTLIDTKVNERKG